MSEAWFAGRVTLYHRVQQHPDWSTRHYAEHLHRSMAPVKKWKRRIGSPPAPADSVCLSQSRARCTPPPPLSDRVIKWNGWRSQRSREEWMRCGSAPARAYPAGSDEDEPGDDRGGQNIMGAHPTRSPCSSRRSTGSWSCGFSISVLA